MLERRKRAPKEEACMSSMRNLPKGEFPELFSFRLTLLFVDVAFQWLQEKNSLKLLEVCVTRNKKSQ